LKDKIPLRATFVQSNSSPPTGWVYEEKLDGKSYMFQSSMRLGLMSQLRQWYHDKKMEWPGDIEMRARVEEFICNRVPAGFCKGGNAPAIPFLSTSRIRDVTRLMLNRAFRGDAAVLVPPEEADRRAKICANCPNNLHGICTSCAGNEFQDILRWLIAGRRTTQYDSYLDTCAVCGCLIRAKLWVKTSELAKTEKQKYPKNCWLSGSEADLPDPPEGAK